MYSSQLINRAEKKCFSFEKFFLIFFVAFSLVPLACNKRKAVAIESKSEIAQRSSLRVTANGIDTNNNDALFPEVANSDIADQFTRNIKMGSREEQLADIDNLVRIGSPQAVELLASFIAAQQDGDFKDEVVRDASLIDNNESIPAVLDLINTTHDAGVLRLAQAIFARVADAETLQTVLDAYDDSSDETFRERLVQSVSSITNENTVPVLMKILSNMDAPATDGMIKSSAHALRQIGTAPAVDALIERINSETSEDNRALLGAEIGKITNPLAEASLQLAAGGESKIADTPDARTAAIWALVNHPSAETRQALKLLQNDTNMQVSFAATEALKLIEQRSSVP